MQHAMSIRQKMFLVFILLILTFIATGIYSAVTLSSINEGALRIATEHLQGVISTSESGHSVSDYRQGEFAVIDATTLPGRIYAAQSSQKLADQIDITFDYIQPSLEGDVATQFADMRNMWNQYKENSAKVIDLAKQGNTAEAARLLESSSDKYNYIQSKLNKVLDNRKDFIHAEVVASESSYNQARFILIVAIIAVVAFSIVMAVILSRAILTSIDYLSEVSKEMAAGNLTVEAVPKNDDEFGQLTAIFADTIKQLRQLVSRIQRNANDASNFAIQLNKNATQSAEITQRVSASINNVAESMDTQGVEIAQSTEDMRNFSALLQTFANKANSSVRSAQNVAEIAQTGRTAVSGAVNQMSAVAASVEKSAEVIKQLAERSTQIGNITATIAGIAEQTNLLALNAAIEAARAGTAGRGFAVVADEVRKLAESSSEAASQIGGLIHTIQSEMGQALKQMEQGNEEVENGKVVVAEAGDSFQNITDAITKLTKDAEEIQRDAQNASSSVAKLVETMDELNRSSEDVSVETESVRMATEEQSNSIEEVANASQRLSYLAKELTASTAKFKI